MRNFGPEETEDRPDWLLRSLGWILRRIGPGNLVQAVFLAALVGSAAQPLAGLVRDLEPLDLLAAGLFGAAVGWLAAGSGLPLHLRGVFHWALACLLVLLFVFAYGAHLWELYRALLLALDGLARHALAWFPGKEAFGLLDRAALDGRPAWQAALDLWRANLGLAVRVGWWMRSILSGGADVDPLAARLGWGAAFGIAAAWAGGWFRWGRPLVGSLPLGAMLGASLAYSARSPAPLPIFLLVALLAAAWSSASRRQAAWQRTGVDYSEDLGLDQALAAVSAGMLVFALAAGAPHFTPGRWLDALRPSPPAQSGDGGIGLALGLPTGLPAPSPVPVSPVLEPLRQGGLPQIHLLGSGPELSQQVAMVVQIINESALTAEMATYPAPEHTAAVYPTMPQDSAVGDGDSGTAPLPAYRWRSLTYDLYTGRGWAAGATFLTDHAAGGWSLAPTVGEQSLPPDFARVRLDVRLVDTPTGLLYAPGDLAFLDQPYQAAWRRMTSPPELLNIDLFGATFTGDRYQAVSVMARPSLEQLQEASSELPEWVRRRYLQLPESLPRRVSDLALRLTAAAPSPYARAALIQDYLRSFPYSLEIPAPPEERDVVDYFLFDLQTGYCDYYASAMVVLARAAGVPARLATGYASGRYDAANSRYIVTQADAHSWPELYFAGIGWVTFEPTPAQAEAVDDQAAALDQAMLDQILAEPAATAAPAWTQSLRRALLSVLGVLGGGLALMGVGLACAWLGEAWLLRRMRPSAVLPAIYARLLRAARPITASLPPGATPNERAAALEIGLAWPHARAGRLARLVDALLAGARRPLGELTALYNRQAYGPRPIGEQEKAAALRAWGALRWKLWVARLRRKR